METFFAPAGRTEERELARQLDLVASSGLVSALLHSTGMVLAVVNRQRQIVARLSRELAIRRQLAGPPSG